MKISNVVHCFILVLGWNLAVEILHWILDDKVVIFGCKDHRLEQEAADISWAGTQPYFIICCDSNAPEKHFFPLCRIIDVCFPFKLHNQGNTTDPNTYYTACGFNRFVNTREITAVYSPRMGIDKGGRPNILKQITSRLLYLLYLASLRDAALSFHFSVKTDAVSVFQISLNGLPAQQLLAQVPHLLQFLSCKVTGGNLPFQLWFAATFDADVGIFVENEYSRIEKEQKGRRIFLNHSNKLLYFYAFYRKPSLHPSGSIYHI